MAFMPAMYTSHQNDVAMLCSFVAAMNVPGGGKNDIPNRLTRHFAIFYVPPPSDAAVNSMFGALIQVCHASTLVKLAVW